MEARGRKLGARGRMASNHIFLESKSQKIPTCTIWAHFVHGGHFRSSFTYKTRLCYLPLQHTYLLSPEYPILGSHRVLAMLLYLNVSYKWCVLWTIVIDVVLYKLYDNRKRNQCSMLQFYWEITRLKSVWGWDDIVTVFV